MAPNEQNSDVTLPKGVHKVIVQSESGWSSARGAALEALIAQGPALIAIHGKECELVEDLCDELAVGDGTTPAKNLMTTSHPNESLEEVIEFVREFDRDHLGDQFLVIRW